MAKARVALKGSNVTDFQKRVYGACEQIPKGHFSTYMAIARALKSSPRAVGGALRVNPYAPKVPCHRVVASNFYIGGFNKVWGNPKKKDLLQQEGLIITEDDYIAESHRKERLVTEFKLDREVSPYFQ